jgi:uncharacterized damage-inducible protein DinB
MVEPWLRGPIAGMPPVVMPAAHALMQAAEDITAAAVGLTAEQLWMRPGGAASVGFHLRHVAGSIDRLLTYARNEMLSQAQLAAIAREQDAGANAADAATLAAEAVAAIDVAIQTMRATPPGTYFDARGVGRRRLPTNVLGLLVHVAEHTQRHSGQIIATAKVVRAAGAGTPHG